MEIKSRHPLLSWSRAEIGFFFIFFFVFGFIQEIQYYGHPDLAKQTWDSVIYAIAGDCFTVIPYALYYKLLTPLLIRKQWLRFTLLLLAGIFVFDWYIRFMDWSIANMPFLPEKVNGYGRRALKNTKGIFGRQSVMLTLQRLICVTALAYWQYSQLQQRRLNQMREDQLRLQLDNLKAQLHPHFFFNTLNNIYALALKGSPFTAEIISRLSDLMRYILDQTSRPLVPLKGEIEFLVNYIALERIRHPNPDQVRFSSQGNFGGLVVPPLLLLTFVENAFKHGLGSDTTSFAEILLVYADGQLTLKVENSYSGGPNETGYPGGMGISNARQRLNLLYPERHELVITDSERFFSVTLHIQLQSE